MKVFLLLLLPFVGFSQSKTTLDRLFIGTSISDKDKWMVNIHGEIDGEIAFLRATANTNLYNYGRLDLKIAFRVCKENDLEFFVALPPMYYTVGKGYITPINVEVQWKKYLMFNIDWYKNGPVFSIQARVPQIKKKK